MSTIDDSPEAPFNDVPSSAVNDVGSASDAGGSSSEGNGNGAGNDIYEHNNYVYILDKQYSWIPAIVAERKNETLNITVPQYKSEQAIQCDGGRTASRFEKQTVDFNDVKTLALYPSKHLPLQNVNHEGELQMVEDMVDLSFLHEVRSSIPIGSVICYCFGLFLGV
jgi:hypothetical protein